MADIRIPFLEKFHRPMVLGWKSATTRSKRYGRKGDRFPLEIHFPEGCPAYFIEWADSLPVSIHPCGGTEPHRHEWELIADPVKVHLSVILDALWDLEGMVDTEDAWDTWRQIHPRRSWTGSELPFLHRFKRIG